MIWKGCHFSKVLVLFMETKKELYGLLYLLYFLVFYLDPLLIPLLFEVLFGKRQVEWRTYSRPLWLVTYFLLTAPLYFLLENIFSPSLVTILSENKKIQIITAVKKGKMLALAHTLLFTGSFKSTDEFGWWCAICLSAWWYGNICDSGLFVLKTTKKQQIYRQYISPKFSYCITVSVCSPFLLYANVYLHIFTVEKKCRDWWQRSWSSTAFH